MEVMYVGSQLWTFQEDTFLESRKWDKKVDWFTQCADDY
jgi:hypothetical protein